MTVRLVTEGKTETLLTLPETLRGPVAARIKDGASMNVEDSETEQVGVTPVFDSRAERLYDMHVTCRPTARGEMIELQLVRSNETL